MEEIKIEIVKTNGETLANTFKTVEEAKAFIDEVCAEKKEEGTEGTEGTEGAGAEAGAAA